MRLNNRTCRASGKTDPLLLYAASKSVSWFTLRSKHVKRVADNLNQVVGISYDGEYVYWTDISVQVESIMKAKTDGTDIEVLLTKCLENITSTEHCRLIIEIFYRPCSHLV